MMGSGRIETEEHKMDGQEQAQKPELQNAAAVPVVPEPFSVYIAMETQRKTLEETGYSVGATGDDQDSRGNSTYTDD